MNITEEQDQKEEYLDINDEQFDILKNKYREAVSDNDNSFIFQDRELLVNYAKYLIEYLEKNYE